MYSFPDSLDMLMFLKANKEFDFGQMLELEQCSSFSWTRLLTLTSDERAPNANADLEA